MNTPVFPLANVVFFPHTFLPLHVFEPRYRAMVTDALRGERLLVVVLAREERPPGRLPDVHPIGSVGRIEVAARLDDGRYNILLHGLSRVTVGDLSAHPADYFSAAVDLRGEMLPDLQDPRVADAKAAFLMTARRYGEQVLGGGIPADYLTEALPYAVLVNRAASILRTGLPSKQSLLEIDDVEMRAVEIEHRMGEQLESHSSIERFGERRPNDPRMN